MPVDPFDVFARKFPKPVPPARPAVAYGPVGSAGGYAASALAQEVQRVLDAPEGTRNHALNRAAFSLGQLVAGGALDEGEVVDALAAAGRSVGLDDVEILGVSGRGGTIYSGINGGKAEPRGVPERPEADDWIAALPTVGIDGNEYDEGDVANFIYNQEAGEVVEPVDREALLADWHRRQVDKALADMRVKHEASLAHKAELAAATFREPPSVWTLADELAIPDEPVTYHIADLLPTGANALLAAQFKAGKTTLVNNYARSFADGTPFLDRYDVSPAGGRLAIYNYEVGRDQYRRWLRDMDIQNPDRIVILNLRGFRLPLSVPSVEDWVVRWLAERDVTAWVVDPFARASVGIDENSNSEVGVWLDTLDVIKQRAGVRDLVLPTHTGRAEQDAGQERARGATRLDDWADVRWLLTKDDEDRRYFRATGRDVEVAEELLTFDEPSRRLSIGGGDRRWVKGRDAEARVLAYVLSHPGCTTRDVSGCGGNKPENEAALRSLTAGPSPAVRVERDGNKHLHHANREVV